MDGQRVRIDVESSRMKVDGGPEPFPVAVSAGVLLEPFTQIKDEQFTAQEMRQHLPTVIAKPRILSKYERGDITLDDAHDRAKISGTQQRLKKIRDGLDDIEKRDIDVLEHNELRAVEQVFRQIRQRLKRVGAMIDAKVAGTKD